MTSTEHKAKATAILKALDHPSLGPRLDAAQKTQEALTHAILAQLKAKDEEKARNEEVATQRAEHTVCHLSDVKPAN